MKILKNEKKVYVDLILSFELYFTIDYSRVNAVHLVLNIKR